MEFCFTEDKLLPNFQPFLITAFKGNLVQYDVALVRASADLISNLFYLIFCLNICALTHVFLQIVQVDSVIW